MARPAEELVIARATGHASCPGVGVQGIVAASTTDEIGPTVAVNGVITAEPDDYVVPGRTGQCIVPASTDDCRRRPKTRWDGGMSYSRERKTDQGRPERTRSQAWAHTV
jgi:hypothetical protein